MISNWFIIILIMMLIVSIIGFIFKSIAKGIISVLIVVLLFKAVFIWDFNSVSDYIGGDKGVIKEEYQDKVESGLKSFFKKRDELSIIDANKVEDLAKEIIQEKSEEVKEKYTKEEIEKIIIEIIVKGKELSESELRKEIERELFK